MKKYFILAGLLFQFLSINAQEDVLKTSKGELKIHPVNHGAVAFQWNGKTIYVDPFGGASIYKNIPPPDLILITDIHGDHFHPETLKALPLEQAIIVVPEAVKKLMSDFKHLEKTTKVLNNGEETDWQSMRIEAIPMYNLPESKDSRHPKGRGNGYILEWDTTRIYISGDTEDIPEMRSLKNIDIAFVCMNLPYTMSVDQAANAVLDFKPRIVYPYHYRGQEGLSDIQLFKSLVLSKDKGIEVRLRDWYSNTH